MWVIGTVPAVANVNVDVFVLLLDAAALYEHACRA
jgi:hypothetical protein